VLSSDHHRLRALESSDVPVLYAWENDSADWWMGASVLPISREAMASFASGNHDLYRDRQLRWMLDARQDAEQPWHAVGAVDLYDFDPRQLRAGVAVHIDPSRRRQGHARAGLTLLDAYVRTHLGLHQVYAEVPATHVASLSLFVQLGFVETGRRESWIRLPEGAWSDVVTLQRIYPTSTTG
jgi:diamine N-acetyltransferase